MGIGITGITKIGHKVGAFADADLVTHPIYDGRATGLTYAPFVNRRAGSAHTGFGIASLTPGGATETTIHAFEKGVFVLDGEFDFLRDGHAYRLSAGDFVLIPTAVPHAWRNSSDAEARCVMVESPQPKPPEGWQDTWFTGPVSWPDAITLANLGAPRLSGFGHYDVENQPP